MDPKQYSDKFKEQGSGFELPPPGTYHVVNVGLKFVTFGSGTKALRITSKILKCIHGDGESFVGKKFSQDLWWNLAKEANQNRLMFMAIACGQTEAFNENMAADLVKALTGKAYLIQLSHRKEEYEGKERVNLNVIRVDRLPVDVRKSYADQPDWKTTVGDPAKRMGEPETIGKGGGKPKKQETTADPFSDGTESNDIPF